MREILLKRVESRKYLISADDIEGNFEEINYNIILLRDAGYVETEPSSWIVYEDGDRHIPIEVTGIKRLTNDGHDYLDSVRDPNIYN